MEHFDQEPLLYRLDPHRLRHAIEQTEAILSEHLTHLRAAPVKAQVKPGFLAHQFPQSMPTSGKPLESLLTTVEQHVMPAVTNWQHPKFFAYYPATTSLPAIISEMIIATLGSLGLQWSANPAATELECVVMDWLMDLVHAPLDSPFRHTSRLGGGIIQNTAGEALAIIMVAARIEAHRRSHSTLSVEELAYQDSSKLVAYMSDQTHFSGPKAVRVAGMRVHTIKATRLPHGNYGITAQDVRDAMEKDRARGLIPCLVQLNFGSTNTCGRDDFGSFLGFAEQENIWLHVDAAYAGPALMLAEWKAMSLAIQAIATSFNFNGSKWLLCGFDSAFLFIRDRNLLKRVFAADGNYLAPVQDEDIYNPEFKDWAIPLGRKCRALRIWMVLSYFGRDGLEKFLRDSIALADYARSRIDASSTLQQFVTTDLGLVCFRLKSDDKAKNAHFLTAIETSSNNGRDFLIYPSMLEQESFLRLALGGIGTTLDDVKEILDACERLAQKSLA